jgi:hypothetical protein
LARLGTPWKSAITDPDIWLARHGWAATVHTPAELATRYRRKIMKSATLGWLIEAIRIEDDTEDEAGEAEATGDDGESRRVQRD